MSLGPAWGVARTGGHRSGDHVIARGRDDGRFRVKSPSNFQAESKLPSRDSNCTMFYQSHTLASELKCVTDRRALHLKLCILLAMATRPVARCGSCYGNSNLTEKKLGYFSNCKRRGNYQTWKPVVYSIYSLLRLPGARRRCGRRQSRDNNFMFQLNNPIP